MRDGLAANTRHYATCDGCKKVICGIRYKCMHPDCPDFDLCAKCESHPIPVHPSKHPMLRMKTADTVVPTVYRVGQTTLIHSGPFPKDIKEEDKALPTPPMPTEFEDEKLEAEVEASTEELKSQPSSMTSSTAGFKLPPLALDSRKDLFCEFWPKVAEELKEAQTQKRDVPQPNPPAPTTGREYVAELTDPFRDPVPKSTGFRSPMTTQSLPLIQDCHPYPQSTSSLAASVGSLDDTSQNEPTSVVRCIQYQEEQSLVGRFLSDTTVPDGQIFPPGAEFVKSWRILNDGPRDWPESTELHYTAGENFALAYSSQNVKVGKVAAGLEVDVWTGELKVLLLLDCLASNQLLMPYSNYQAPETPGKYRCYWRLNDGEGTYFGNSLWVECVMFMFCCSQPSDYGPFLQYCCR
jgi:next-to-BRCA1 protein 1